MPGSHINGGVLDRVLEHLESIPGVLDSKRFSSGRQDESDSLELNLQGIEPRVRLHVLPSNLPVPILVGILRRSSRQAYVLPILFQPGLDGPENINDYVERVTKRNHVRIIYDKIVKQPKLNGMFAILNQTEEKVAREFNGRITYADQKGIATFALENIPNPSCIGRNWADRIKHVWPISGEQTVVLKEPHWRQDSYISRAYLTTK